MKAGEQARAPRVRPCSRCRAGRSRGVAERWAVCAFPCALGRSGCRARKREGDGATPIGRWRCARSSIAPTACAGRARRLPVRRDRRHDGWCDAPGRPQLQPARAPSLSGERRAPVAGGWALRRGRRARPQRPAARARARQRHLHARRAAGLRADRGLHRPRARAPAARARAARAAVGDRVCAVGRAKKAPGAFAPGVQEHVPGKWRARQAARPDGARASPQTASVVVSALAVIDEVEALALLVGAGPQTDERPQDHEDDG